MPVRIYEIAKKLGIESKEVLSKAKELGIAAAKVPSSSLDKITAEFLEEQLAAGIKKSQPAPPPPPSIVTGLLVADALSKSLADPPTIEIAPILVAEPVIEPINVRVEPV